MPFPFSSAMAIVSDLDGTTKCRFKAYTDQMCGDLGLDFGDSYWLQWRTTVKNKMIKASRETGFFSYSFGYGSEEPASRYWHTLTFNEALHQFHTGNLDHFHSLLSTGPRTILLSDFNAEDRGYIARLGPCRAEGTLRTRNIYVLSVVIECEHPENLVSITIKPREGKEIHCDLIGEISGRRCEFNLWGSPDESKNVATMDNIESVKLNYKTNTSNECPDYVFLLTAPTSVLINRLRLLREDYQVETNLVTDHASYHFRNERSAALKDRRMQDEHDKHLPLTQSIHGSYYSDDGSRICTTDADDPESLSRVFPELTDSFGVRFVNPAACTASSVTGFNPLNLVTPSLTRAGSGVYVSRRTKPNIGKLLEGKLHDGIKSRQSTLVDRVKVILKGASSEPNLCWPLYTHIGSLNTNSTKEDQHTVEGKEARSSFFKFDDEGNELGIPDPYFDQSGMKLLQNSVYNISGDVIETDRMWFTRASVIYEYSLMLRSIADHITREGPNQIAISSWYDPVLDRQLPISSSQLYGITLYVQDSSKAEVFLDGVPIKRLSRNPEDESGQESVTILDTDIRHVVFEQLDPVTSFGADAHLSHATWAWNQATDSTPGFGRMLLSNDLSGDDLIGTVSLNKPDTTHIGAQTCSFSIRTTGNTKAGVLLKTHTGGTFFFGSQSILDTLDEPVSASYVFELSREHSWETITVPFYNLHWNKSLPDNVPLPSHMLESLTLMGMPENTDSQNVADHSEAESTVDIGNFCFHRPRTTTCQSGTESYCITGSVRDGGRDTTVTLHNEFSGEVKQASCDIQGYFNFTSLPKSIYSISAESNGKSYTNKRGNRIEVSTNQTHATLDTEC